MGWIVTSGLSATTLCSLSLLEIDSESGQTTSAVEHFLLRTSAPAYLYFPLCQFVGFGLNLPMLSSVLAYS